jgi:hypothetical protein
MSYQYREQSLEQKVADAALVVIGTVSATSSGPSKNGSHDSASLTIEQTLKGKSPTIISVATESSFSEADPNCCEAGARYLMFLRGTPGGPYHSVNGRFGIYRIDAPTPVAKP